MSRRVLTVAPLVTAGLVAAVLVAGTGPAGAAGPADPVGGLAPVAAGADAPAPGPESAPFLDGTAVGGNGAVAGTAGTAGPARAMAAPAAPQPVPVAPVALPVAAEPLQPYVAADSCDPRDKVGTTKLGDLLRSTYPGTSYGISRGCGTDGLSTSEHYEGRAVDWMTSVRTPLGAARAKAFLDWLLATDGHGTTYANARRLGVMYVIWNDRMWRAYRPEIGWQPYSSCAAHPEPAYDTTCHRDHVHLSLGWAGAQGRTSFWTGTVASLDYGPCRPADLNWAAPYVRPRTTACPAYPVVRPPAGASTLLRRLTTFSGMQVPAPGSGPVVAEVQRAVGATADGDFGPLTLAAVKAFQTANGVPASGVVDAATWRAMLTVVRGPALPDPSASPTPKPPTTTPTPPTTTPKPTPKPTTKTRPVLRPGARGPYVRLAQKALHVRVDGAFGPVTLKAVKAFQKRHGIPVTGNIGPLTWKALKV